jgi:hypothetical protein
MTYHDIIGRLMMLATRLEAEGKELDRQACAEAAGVLMGLNSARVMPHPSLMRAIADTALPTNENYTSFIHPEAGDN